MTAGIVAIVKGCEPVGEALMENLWVLIPAMIVLVVTAVMPICCKSLGRKVPLNYIILFTFVFPNQTFCASIMVSVACLPVDTTLVLAAGLLTLLVTAGLVLSVVMVRTT